MEYEPANKITTTTSTTTTTNVKAASPTTTIDGTDPYSLFIFAMNSPVTREVYVRRLKRFFEFLGLQGTIEDQCRAFAERGRSDVNWAFANIVAYLQFHRQRVERKEIAAATLRNHVKTLRLFCEMVDIEIRWKKVTRGFPRARKYADDRAPTVDELRLMTKYPDRRINAIVYTMATSGIRLGAWDYLRWGHVKPIQRDGRIVAARWSVYAGEEDQYFTFITSEAYHALEGWMQYRTECGDSISEKSGLMRDLWEVSKPRAGGMVTAPKRLKSAGLKRLVERALWAQGVRKPLEDGQKRHEIQADHGMRKWFKTRCEIAGVKPINVEELMSHSTGVSDSYYRVTEDELLTDYLKAVPALTINDEDRLRMELVETQKEAANLAGMKTALREKDNMIEALMSRQANLEQFVQSLVDSGALKATRIFEEERGSLRIEAVQ